jgi:hypothetical protein
MVRKAAACLRYVPEDRTELTGSEHPAERGAAVLEAVTRQISDQLAETAVAGEKVVNAVLARR